MAYIIRIAIVFLLLLGCSWSPEVIDRGEPRIIDHAPKNQICLIENRAFFSFVYSYENPNRDIQFITAVYGNNTTEDVGELFDIDIGCPECNYVEIEVEMFSTDEGLWLVDVWLTDIRGKPSEVYSYYLEVGECEDGGQEIASIYK